MATKRTVKRRLPTAADDRLLNGFFRAWSRADTPKIANKIFNGHVTGAAIAKELKWTWDKVSRRTDELRSGGIVTKRHSAGWMKTTLATVGVSAAQRWATLLQEPGAASPDSPWTGEDRLAAAKVLAHEGGRRFLLAIMATPGATQADLARICGLSQPTASRWLKDVEAAGFVEVRRDDGRARHHIRPETVGRLRAWLDDLAAKMAKGALASENVVLQRPGMQVSSAAPQEAPSPVPLNADSAVTPALPEAKALQGLNDDEPVVLPLGADALDPSSAPDAAHAA